MSVSAYSRRSKSLQGDPLAPFLYLIVVEGLSGLMKNAVSLGIFKGVKIEKEGPEVSILYYADDTILVGEATWENLWVMKSVLRCFELISGLEVNFKKTRVVGINVEEGFIRQAANFLNCKEGDLPFTYLGLPVGANPKRLST